MSRNPFLRSEYVPPALGLFYLALAVMLVLRLWVIPPTDARSLDAAPVSSGPQIMAGVRVVCTVQWADAPEWGVKSPAMQVGESFRVAIQRGPPGVGELECVVHP